MDIFVVPSISPSETFGVAAFEASSCSIPVIASDIGGLPEVVKDGTPGFLVPPCDVNAIADRIIRLIDNPWLRLQMGIEGRKYVKSIYDIQICGSLMRSKYEEILRR